MSVQFEKIGELVEINPRVPKDLAADTTREVDFIPMSQLSGKGVIKANGSKSLGEVMKGYTYFANGDVLVAKITPCMENGKRPSSATFRTALLLGQRNFMSFDQETDSMVVTCFTCFGTTRFGTLPNGT